jgi:hypothetical protein
MVTKSRGRVYRSDERLCAQVVALRRIYLVR